MQAGARVVDAQVLALDGIAHQADDGLDGDAAGDLAGVIAAHTVGQHQQPDVGIVGDGVLVVIANPTGVGQAHTTQLPLEAQPASCARHDGVSYKTLNRVTLMIRTSVSPKQQPARAAAAVTAREHREAIT